MAVFQSISGLDSLTGTSGNDSFIFTQFSNDNGDNFDGSSGNDSFDLSIGPGYSFALTTYDFTGTQITSFESVNFVGVGSNREAAFFSSQFGAGLSHSLSVSASDLAQRILVTMDAPGVFSAGLWTFSNWSNNTGFMAYDDLVVISGSSSGDIITGSSATDYLYGNGGNDTIDGGNGADTLTGGMGLDHINGGAGNDLLIINDGYDVVAGEVYDGGSGYDILYLPNGLGDLSTVTLMGIEMLQGNGANTVYLTISQIGGITTFYHTDVGLGETGAITLASTQAAHYYLNTLGNTLDGSAVLGNLTVYGSFGADVIYGGNGNDYIRGGLGADVIFGGIGDDDIDAIYGFPDGSYDQVVGGAGNDSVTLGYNAVGDGGTGFDTLFINAFNQTQGITIDLSAIWTGGTATNGTGTLTGFEALGDIIGSNSNDTITVGTGGFVATGIAPPVVRGYDGDDQLTGGNDRDLLFGDDGNDTLTGLDGDDQLAGFDGNDHIDGGDGDDFINGGLGTDILIGGTGSDTYSYVQGDAPSQDVIIESANDVGIDVLFMNVATNVADGVFTNLRNIEAAEFVAPVDIIGSEVVLGAEFEASGIRTVTAWADIDSTALTADMNFIVSRIGPIRPLSLFAGSGDDTVSFDQHALPNFIETYTLSGGAGYDTLVFRDGFGARSLISSFNQPALITSGFECIKLEGLRETGVVGGPDIAGTVEFYNLTLTDSVVASGQTMRVDARALNVNVVYNLGIDQEIGGSGINADRLASDILHLDASQLSSDRAVSLLGGATNDTAVGGAGDDIIDGGQGTDVMTGGAGNDIYYVDNVGDGIVENANEGTDSVFSSISFALFQSSQSLESLTLTGTANINAAGNAQANIITGNSGDNILNGGNGNDTLIGGAGNDIFQDTAGADVMTGGAGNDIYYVDNVGDGIVENANEGTDSVFSSISFALFQSSQSLESLTLTGTANINAAGNAQANIITGNSGDNILNGGNGNDTLIGGAGNDIFQDTAGADVMTGGTGNDRFIFDDGQFGGLDYISADRVSDFSSSEGDKIDLSPTDANLSLVGDQAFMFIGAAAFSGNAGELRYENNGIATLILGDANGDGLADLAIRLDGVFTLQASDFVL